MRSFWFLTEGFYQNKNALSMESFGIAAIGWLLSRKHVRRIGLWVSCLDMDGGAASV
jgi:hypothetical protein